MTDLEKRAINTIRFLAVDAIQKAKSGHPGLPMGAAPMTYVLWHDFLKHNPKNPKWPDRDRFVLSAGHGSMMLYALLYLTGYKDVTMDQLKSFRQWGSLTPGHPEWGVTPGVEATTGPLGQGISNAVGMAIAERFLGAKYNKDEYKLMDHYTYVLASDGDLMEGVASEAASIAGHQKLGKLIVLYDDNKISLAAPTSASFTEDVAKRFEAYGWQILRVEDGNEDLDAIRNAIKEAQSDVERPTLIMVRTTIGYGSPKKAGTPAAHGSPLGEDEVKAAKENLGWPTEPDFYVPEDVLNHFREAVEKGEKAENEWNNTLNKYKEKYPDEGAEWDRIWEGKLPDGWEKSLPQFKPEDGPLPTRKASGAIINAIASVVPNFIGGAADLEPSTNTYMKDMGDQGADNPTGRNIRFGVREHGMGAIVNGIAYHGGLIPFGSTFLVFSDYMRGSIRVSALAGLHTIWVLSHDSVWLGEDGPTHQPVEHLASLRAIPNLVVIRAADANEMVEAWKVAMQCKGPVVLTLSRHGLPILDRSVYASAENLKKGAYVLKDADGGKPDLILIATGSEVSVAIEAAKIIEDKGVKVRIVSMPSWELFDKQDQSYKDEVLPPDIKERVVVETGSSMGWCKYTGEKGIVISQDRFGASAPYKVLLEKFGFTPEQIAEKALKVVGK